MVLDWFSQIFPCLSVRRVHDSVDVPDVATETRSAPGRQFSAERRRVTERRPSVESRLSAERDYLERQRTLASLQFEGPPPKGREETLSWLDNGNDAGVIAARDAADRQIRESLSTEVGDISCAAAEAARTQRDFDRDENGLPLFAVGSPGSASPFTPGFPSAPRTKETLSQCRGPFPRESPSLDITSSARSPPSSTASSPSRGSRPNDWRHLDLPYTGAVWPFGVGYESFSERINALSLAVPKKNQAAEEDICWKRGSVNSRRPVLHIAMVRPRAASIESPSECGSQANDLPELPTIVSPSDHGSHEDDSPKLTTVLALTSELGGLADDSSSSDDGRADSPVKPANDSGFGSMTSDSDSGHDVHPESPAIDKLADDGSINSDVPIDSPASTTKSTTIEELIDDINGFLDGISRSHTTLAGALEVDKSANDSNRRSEVRQEPSPPSPMVSVV